MTSPETPTLPYEKVDLDLAGLEKILNGEQKELTGTLTDENGDRQEPYLLLGKISE